MALLSLANINDILINRPSKMNKYQFGHSINLENLWDVPEWSPILKTSFLDIDKKCIHKLQHEEIHSCTRQTDGTVRYELADGTTVGLRDDKYLYFF